MSILDDLWALRSELVLKSAEVPRELHLGAEVWDALCAEVDASAMIGWHGSHRISNKVNPKSMKVVGINVYIDYDNKQRMEFK